jgi:hypothetical protein
MSSHASSEQSRQGTVVVMPPRTAIFYAENPMAILRDFPDDCDQAKALAAMDRALSVAAENDPLAHEA